MILCNYYLCILHNCHNYYHQLISLPSQRALSPSSALKSGHMRYPFLPLTSPQELDLGDPLRKPNGMLLGVLHCGWAGGEPGIGLGAGWTLEDGQNMVAAARVVAEPLCSVGCRCVCFPTVHSQSAARDGQSRTRALGWDSDAPQKLAKGLLYPESWLLNIHQHTLQPALHTTDQVFFQG